MTTTELAGPRRCCAYDAAAPRRAPSARLRSDHDLVRAAIARVQQIHDKRDDPPAPLLNRPGGRRRKGHVPEPRIVSYLRGERAEAVGVLLALLVDRADLRTGEIGRWHEGVLEHRFPVDELERDTGLSRDRLERSISTALAAGWLWSRQGRELDGERWIGHVAIRKLTSKFWEDIGLGGPRDRLLKDARDEEERQRRKQVRRETRATELTTPDDGWNISRADRIAFKSMAIQVAQENAIMGGQRLTKREVNLEAAKRLNLPPPPDDER